MQNSVRRFTSNELALLNFLRTYKSSETEKCTPSYRQMGTATGLTARQCQRLIEKLVASGALEKEEHWFLYPGEYLPVRTGNLYRLRNLEVC
jgi:hypothetical protein